MNKRFVFMLAFIFIIFLTVSLCTPKPDIICPLKIVELETEPQKAEQTIATPKMIFSQEEADALLTRFAREREEEERAKRIEKERKAAAERVAHATFSPAYFQRAGRIWWGAWSWTYYSERILPGYGLRIPGRHTDSMGYVRDSNGYLCLASDVLKKGTVIETPFGSCGKVYDCGCGNNYTVDVYVGW